jgi:hypothetical protein
MVVLFGDDVLDVDMAATKQRVDERAAALLKQSIM